MEKIGMDIMTESVKESDCVLICLGEELASDQKRAGPDQIQAFFSAMFV